MNSEKEKRYLIGEEDLPIVLLHGTMGKSEDWSRVVEELSNFRMVIRPNYIERVAGANTTDERAIKNLQPLVVPAIFSKRLSPLLENRRNTQKNTQ
jgi:hypothetical protein